MNLVLLGLGLFASVFHLGKPEYMFTRSWRAITRWRTSWLSREIITLPAFMFMVFVYGVLHFFGWDPNVLGTSVPEQGRLTLLVGGVTTVVAFALFVCTGMIYACLKFLQEWHSPLTVINYILLGGASGFMLATAYAALAAPGLVDLFGTWAGIITMLGLLSRGASLIRNARLKPKSTVQSAIGVRHTQIVQKAQGFMGGSFNTREFFHGAKAGTYRSVKWIFLVLAFPVPLLLLALGLGGAGAMVLAAAFGVQYLGLIFERWFFFAQANHPQNIYYQTV